MRIETRGPTIGVCNICGARGPLTVDHIPPKRTPRVGQAMLVDFASFLNAEPATRTNRLFQNGIAYRSLCSRCNNTLLGARYDPVLVELARSIDTAGLKYAYLPLQVETQPNRLVRSVIGHLLAHGLALHGTGDFFIEMSRYFLDESANLPVGYRMYCWLYPYNDQFASQCSGRLRFGGGTILQSILKFYPVAFLLTKDGPPEVQSGLTCLDSRLSADIEHRVTLDLALSGLPPRRWPEMPGDEDMIMHTPLNLGARRDFGPRASPSSSIRKR